MSIKGKLNRMKNHLSINENVPLQHLNVEQNYNEIPYIDKWMRLDCQPNYLDEEYSFVREVRYPIKHQHGRYSFEKLFEVHKEWKEQNLNHPLSIHDVPIRNLMFFDTETTGLSSGAGNYIFLIGYAMVLNNEIVVKQHFIPSPSSEVPMYHAFLNDFTSNTKLVSYNGKSFDWPQVKTRHTFVRESVPALPEFAHFDLLHAARRLWKHELSSCKLSVIEKEVLGFERVDDTPGYLAPMLYFDFLQEKDPDYIEGIIKHNEWDVLSLICLYNHISNCVLNKNAEELTVREKFEIGRWFEHLGEIEMAKYYYKRTLIEDGNLKEAVSIALAQIYKKQGRYERARDLLEGYYKYHKGMHREGMIELAMLYEHQFKEIDLALFYARKASDFPDEGRGSKSFKSELTHRIKRLEIKLQG